MQAAQQALDVTAQNVANANTPGYSRQRVDQAAIQSNPYLGMNTGHQAVLSGVEVTDVERIKSEFLQTAASTAVGKQSSLQSQVNPLNDVQSMLNEPGDNGLQASIDNFYTSWHELANNPTPALSTAGVQVLATGAAVATQLNSLSHGLSEEWQNQHATLVSVVDQANAAAATVASLNTQIVSGTVAELNVNDLMDQRDKAVNTLASLVGGVSIPGSDGQTSVSVNGIALVSGGYATKLKVAGGGDITTAATDPPTLMIDSAAATPSFGSAAGLLSSLGTDLPSISSRMDGVATSLRDAVNGLQDAGFTLAGDSGTDFFAGTGAGDLNVALTTADQIAVSSLAGGQDGGNALKIANLADDGTAAAALGGTDGPSVQYRSLTAGLGTQVQSLNTALTSQTAIVTSTQSAVDSDSGVSLDEELTNMLLYQRSYQASAKVITTTDEMLQTLIGMVS